MFKFNKTGFEGLYLIEPQVFIDNRGRLKKSFECDVFRNKGIDFVPTEEIETSSKKGVLRGIHFQKVVPQAKLIRVAKGEIFDVVVDLRRESKTFGKVFTVFLSQTNMKMLYVPAGFGHAVLSMEEDTIFYYLCQGKYCPELDSGIIWDDDSLSIKWPLSHSDIIVSEKDQNLSSFKDICCSNEI